MSAELAETATAAEVVEPLNREDAEKLDRRIRRMAVDTKGKLDTLGALVADAKAGRIHEVLDGYPSWTAYLVDALGELCSGQGNETRRELVAYLYDVGMSERAIAVATGASKTTVHRDLEVGFSRTWLIRLDFRSRRTGLHYLDHARRQPCHHLQSAGGAYDKC